MIKLKRVKVERAEGPCDLCGTREFQTLAAANEWLAENSLTAPDDGCYDKHDFWIEWEDGQTYDGRVDVEHVSRGGAERLGAHVRYFLRFTYGMLEDSEVPKHLTPHEYRAFTARRSEADRESARKFLATYDLSDF